MRIFILIIIKISLTVTKTKQKYYGDTLKTNVKMQSCPVPMYLNIFSRKISGYVQQPTKFVRFNT